MVSAGVRQFRDIGSGIPTVGNVHELAQGADPEARVVCVDVDPVAVAHSNLILEGNGRAAAMQADLAQPEVILGHQDTRRVLDFGQPIGLSMLRVLHFVPDDRNPKRLLASHREALAPGSYIAMSHLTAEVRPAEIGAVLELVRNTPGEAWTRTREQLIGFFDGFELLEPGVVSLPLWRPSSPASLADGPERDQVLVGVGRKP